MSNLHFDLSLEVSQGEVHDFSGEVQKFSGEVQNDLRGHLPTKSSNAVGLPADSKNSTYARGTLPENDRINMKTKVHKNRLFDKNFQPMRGHLYTKISCKSYIFDTNS
jgi:hypothetical protein